MLLKTEWCGKVRNTIDFLNTFSMARAFYLKKVESGEYKLQEGETLEEYLEKNSHTGWILEEFFGSLPDTYYIDCIPPEDYIFYDKDILDIDDLGFWAIYKVPM